MAATRSRPARRVLPGLVLLLAVLGAAAGLATWSGRATASPPSPSPSATPSPSPGATASPTAVPASASGSLAQGRQVFLRDCAWCHGNQGEGTDNGPSVAGSGAAGADFYLRTGRMPLKHPDDRVQAGTPAYSSRTISSLVAYVASLGNGPAVPVVRAGDAVAGRRLFLSNCAACHSSSGTGMILSGGEWAPELFDTGATQISEAIRLGPGPMPHFTDKQLEAQEVDDIVSYVQELGKPQVIGGNGLDQFGPIAEGLFVWLVVLPILVVMIRLLGRKAPR